MSLAVHMRKMARNNAWANRRLLSACAALEPGAFEATRTSFFPSLSATLNHNLAVDLYYVDALEQGGEGREIFERFQPLGAAALVDAQAACDRRLIVFCDACPEQRLSETVLTDRRPTGQVPERIDDLLAHLFQHQIHHRGQAHAMLAGTDVRPPQLDEYFLVYDSQASRDELAKMGLEEPSLVR